MRRLLTFTRLSWLGLVLLTATAPRTATAVDYEKNLSQVPANDPAPIGTVKLLAAMNGQHPRLLFTKDSMVSRQQQAANDPLLKKIVEDVTAQYRRFKFTPPSGKPDIVLNDTAALSTSFDNYTGLAVAYALSHEPSEKEAIIGILQMMLAQPYWTDADELDSNMGTGNNLFMAAMLFDAVYDDLEPAFRLDMARKLLTHARRLYYLGFLEKGTLPIKYWQQDPQNNHRWHRLAGMAAALLAVADIPELETGWMLEQLKSQMDFLTKWLPPDGDCHEGASYQVFGFIYLAFAADMMDRNLGTKYLSDAGFRNAWAQQLYYWAPGRQGDMSFGDDTNSRTGAFGHRNSGFLLSAHLTGDKNVQAAMVRQLAVRATTNNGRPYVYPWPLVLCYDPTLTAGDYKAVPTYHLFADLGAASMRDSWEDDAVLFTFKCGPAGGFKLNEYSQATPKDGKAHYFNVAHDDPDANSFALGAAGEFYFHPGNYTEYRKLTFYSNDITVDGKGQVTEGPGWLQPVSGLDMRTLSYLTGWKVGDAGRIIVEGEAGPAYKGLTWTEWDQKLKNEGKGGPPPAAPQEEVPIHQTTALKKFRRTAIWMPKDYILILDDIAAEQPAKILWRGIPYKAVVVNAAENRAACQTKDGTKQVDFQILATKPLEASFDFLQMDGRWGNELVNQAQFYANTDAIKFACIIDPWKRKPILSMSEKDGVSTLTVKLDGAMDTWTWQTARNLVTPSVITGTRDGKPLIALTEKDIAPKD